MKDTKIKKDKKDLKKTIKTVKTKKTVKAIKNPIVKLIPDMMESTNLMEDIQKLETICVVKSNEDATIDLSKDQTIKTKDYEKYLERKQLSNKKRLENKNYEYAIEKSKLFSINNVFFEKYIPLIFNYFTSNSKYEKIFINNLNINNDSYSPKIKNCENILMNINNLFYEKEYKGDNIDKKINIINKLLINELYIIHEVLKNNGNALIKLMIFNDKTISIIELYSIFFEEIIIINKNIILCKNFKSNNNDLLKLKDIIKNNYKFIIKNFKDENKIINYFSKLNIINNKIYNTFLKDKDENNFIKNRYYLYLNLISSLGLKNFDEFRNILSLQLIDYFKLKIYDENDIKKIEANINSKEGHFIENIIKKYNFKKCLEVGLAHGISSVYILKNKNTNLISIDPYQKEQWDNQALKFIKHLKLDDRHKLIEKKSYVALPDLLAKEGEKSFEFIFIDGYHTFDYSLLDFFYSDLLLKKDGIIIIDDALHFPVSDCIKYIERNYKHYKKIASPNSVAAFVKIGDDKREWNYHKSIC
jgi:predicted O-methyltransferase YrrM